MNKPVEYGKWYDCKEGNMPEDVLGVKIDINGYCCTEQVIIHAPSSLRHHWQDGISIGYLHSDYISQHRCKTKDSQVWKWEYPFVRPLRWLAIPPMKGHYDWLDDAVDIEEVCKRAMI